MQHSIFTLEEKSEYSIHAIFFYFEEEDKDIKKLIILTYATQRKIGL